MSDITEPQPPSYLDYFQYSNICVGEDNKLRMGDRVFIHKDNPVGSATEANATIGLHPGDAWSGQVLPGLPVFMLSEKDSDEYGVIWWNIADTLDNGFNITRVGFDV